jgi:hypothetical protein
VRRRRAARKLLTLAKEEPAEVARQGYKIHDRGDFAIPIGRFQGRPDPVATGWFECLPFLRGAVDHGGFTVK